MVALLTGVGFVTSAFFFLSRDIYATIVFHNFLGVFGVAQALAASGRLETLDAAARAHGDGCRGRGGARPGRLAAAAHNS